MSFIKVVAVCLSEDELAETKSAFAGPSDDLSEARKDLRAGILHKLDEGLQRYEGKFRG